MVKDQLLPRKEFGDMKLFMDQLEIVDLFGK